MLSGLVGVPDNTEEEISSAETYDAIWFLVHDNLPTSTISPLPLGAAKM